MAKRNSKPIVSLPVRELRLLREALFALDDIHACLQYVAYKEQSRLPVMPSAMNLALARAAESLERLEKHHDCY